jgi:CheY-like chemotaxis protein
MPTALIVEDEPEANKLLAMLVKLRGFQTISAFTGREAIEKAGESEPDVVFLDLMLPDINGYEVCRALKSRQPTSAIPVVIVTARVAADNRFESFSNGADDYIPKPYTPDQIFESLSRAADWRKELDASEVEGSIALDQAESGSLRQLARLRSLLFARGSLTFGTVEDIFSEIHRIWAFADRWAADRRAQAPITLDYVIDARHVRIRLRDQDGWMPDYRKRFKELPVPLDDSSRFVPDRDANANDCLTLDVAL